MRLLRATAALSAVLAIAACGVPIKGIAIPAASTVVTTIPSTPTIIVAPTSTVVVQPPVPTPIAPPPRTYVPASSQWYAQSGWIYAQPWVTITNSGSQTPCQWLYAQGYDYPHAYAAWAQNGYPANWSATGDGYPCQKSYGMQH
ncbi:hypothetical protein OG738_20135 [Amycolatopsis sp. NBC_01488]|uniref:hypothetical protein n=1 Tax=Amycolatopsis sp. NBC_01488 TaxID=2903563 RepID=UPI002E2AC3B3|nr:hypothetical protein [Amycolatopsis sp. NBC_01488]